MESLREKIPFNCIITSPTNCGKTRYLIEMLRQYFCYAFSYIVLICPTYKDMTFAILQRETGGLLYYLRLPQIVKK